MEGIERFIDKVNKDEYLVKGERLELLSVYLTEKGYKLLDTVKVIDQYKDKIKG